MNSIGLLLYWLFAFYIGFISGSVFQFLYESYKDGKLENNELFNTVVILIWVMISLVLLTPSTGN